MTPAKLRKVVAANIRRKAREREIPINLVADFAGVSRSYLYDVLAGRKAATTDWLARVATAVEAEPWELLRPRS